MTARVTPNLLPVGCGSGCTPEPGESVFMMRLLLYAVAYMSLVPCILLLAGALKKSAACWCRISRLQLEGCIIVTATMFFQMFFSGYLKALDASGGSTFYYWFSRGAYGLYSVGAILFFLGFFLERRPRPGLSPWPRWQVRLNFAWMVLWLLAAAHTSGRRYAWEVAAWDPVHVLVAWSALCFSLVYCYRAFKYPAESVHAEGDLIGIEE